MLPIVDFCSLKYHWSISSVLWVLEAAEVGVLDVRIHDTGFGSLPRESGFCRSLRNWPEPVSTESLENSGRHGYGRVKLADAGLTKLPKAWAVVPAEDSSSRMSEVLVGVRDSVLAVDQLECQDRSVNRGPFSHIVPSPNARFVALVAAPTSPTPHQLWVVSADFSRSLSEYDLSSDGEGVEPAQVAWCGSNTVVIAWDTIVLMVGPFGDTLRFASSQWCSYSKTHLFATQLFLPWLCLISSLKLTARGSSVPRLASSYKKFQVRNISI